MTNWLAYGRLICLLSEGKLSLHSRSGVGNVWYVGSIWSAKAFTDFGKSLTFFRSNINVH